MRDALKSTSYWATIISVLVLKWCGPRLEDAHLLLGSVAATYFIGRGFSLLPKVPTAGWATREFTVLVLAFCLLANAVYACEKQAVIALAILVGSYNIGRGLANYYRSKVQMVLNR